MFPELSFFILLIVIVGAFDTLDDEIPSIRTLTEQEIEMSEKAGYSYVDRLAQLEEELQAKGHYAKETSPFHRMAKFRKPSAKARELSRKAVRMLEATRYLKAQMGLTNDESGIGLRQATSKFTVINNTCLAPTTCNSASKYRTIDGSCNNLQIPNLGKSNTVYRRLIKPAYADGIEAPRKANSGSQLPNARLVSATVIGREDKPLTTATLALMQWGQFINHDFQSTAQFTFANGSEILCCSDEGMMDPALLHPACLPISVSDDDPFYNNIEITMSCITLVRSIAGPRLDCSLGYADQLNQNTHWLDASTVYGSDKETLWGVREYDGGRLEVTRDFTNNRDLLPTDPEDCTTTEACFYGGDERVTEQPQLTVMHTVWMREHNRIAKILSALNPTWGDGTIFQETRRIVIAEMQHITYKEFLPALLNAATISKYGLAPLTSGFFTNYSSNLVKSGPVSNEFSTAAFRMGHSLVQGSVKLYDESGNLLKSSYKMSDTFFDATKITKDKTYLDAVIRGLLKQPVQSVDENVDDALWNKLFREPNEVFGYDIVALNIQRGREHGLPGYNTYRQLCGFTKLNSFADLGISSSTSPGFKSAFIKNITSLYTSVEDIDLYVGGLSEIVPVGHIVGPTFSCLIGEHFAKVKYMDRFFYELGGQPHSFTSAQLTEIKKASLTRILCDNSDKTVLSLQPNAFVAVSTTNAKVLCSNTVAIPSLNLTLWKGEKLF